MLRKFARCVGALFGALLLAFVLITIVALEAGGVAVIETRRADGADELRRTRVWPVQVNGALWLESGGAQSAWHQDLLAHPELTLHEDGTRARYRATFDETPAAKHAVRTATHQKYGWRDVWVEIFLANPTTTVPIRLDPIP